MTRRLGVVLLVALTVCGCSAGLKDPVKLESPQGVLDLRSWNFTTGGPVIPQTWLWDADHLWSPPIDGGPPDVPSTVMMGPPDLGGPLGLSRDPASGDAPGTPTVATARLTFLVRDSENYGLQVGAIPGAFHVWSNGVSIWESGVVSRDPLVYRPDGAGTVLTVQPHDGRIELVVAIATNDPLVRHSEYNRLWVLGPARAMTDADQSERNWRALQATFLLLSALVFLGLGVLRPSQRSLGSLVWFLAVCLVKIVVNVEQAQPFLSTVLPGVSPSVYLFLNHAFNLIPFPLMVLFLSRQFPDDVSRRSVWIVAGATLAATLWELLPFVALAIGQPGLYTLVMRSQWSFVLNLYVVLVVLFIFERFYHLFARKRPLAGALFLGGVIIGLVVLLPIPLGYFFPVKYTYFMGWGMFAFLFILGFELIRLQVTTSDAELRRLTERLDMRESLARFLPSGWAARLGKPTLEDLRPGDERRSEVILVQVRSPDPADYWFSQVGTLAGPRQALLVEWRDGTGLWALDSWSETALEFALVVDRRLAALQGLRYRIVLVKAAVQFRVLNSGSSWVATVEKVPRDVLADLDQKAERMGAFVVLDASVRDGLVVGGWRRHRQLTAAGNEIEFYEGQDESLAEIKDRCLDSYESALALARVGRFDEAIAVMLTVVKQNPFDQAARTHLEDWGSRRL